LVTTTPPRSLKMSDQDYAFAKQLTSTKSHFIEKGIASLIDDHGVCEEL